MKKLSIKADEKLCKNNVKKNENNFCYKLSPALLNCP